MTSPLVYPVLPGLTFSVHWIPRFLNIQSQVSASGAEIDLALAATPLHDFELKYNFLRDTAWNSSTEFKTMMGFFLQLGGNLGRFAFDNPDDDSVTSQAIGTGDGATTTFTLPRTFGAGGFGATEPIGWLNSTPTPLFYVNGVLKTVTTDYTLNTTVGAKQTITFTSAPANTLPITGTYKYYYHCKLAAENCDFEKFMNAIWLVQKLVLRSCRPGA